MHLPRMKEIRSRYMSAAESPTRPTILKVVDEESPKETEKLYSPQRVEVDDCEKYQKKPTKSLAINVPLGVWTALSYVIASIVLFTLWVHAEDTSSLYTLASAFQFIAVHGLFDTHHALDTCTAKLLVTSWTFRLTTQIFTASYTPIDSSGDWLHTLIDALSLMCLVGAYLRNTIRTYLVCKFEALPILAEWFICALIISASLFLGTLFNLGLVGYGRGGMIRRDYIHYDVLWAASVYMESVSLIPQVLRMNASKFEYRQNAQFVSMTFLSRLCSTIFWLLTTYEISNVLRDRDVSVPSTLILIAQALQLLSISHVAFYWIKQKARHAADRIANELSCCSMV